MKRGYRLPEVVFWNVASRNRQQPVTCNGAGGVCLSLYVLAAWAALLTAPSLGGGLSDIVSKLTAADRPASTS